MKNLMQSIEEIYKIELEKLKRDYQEIYEFSLVAYFDLDKFNVITQVNLRGAELLEAPRAQLLNKCFSQFISPRSRSLFDIHQQQAFTSQLKQSCELEMLTKNGSPFYAQLESIARPSLNDTLQLRVSIVDITTQRYAEESLKTSEEKYHSLLEITKEWVWAANLDGRYLYSNSAVESILGYSPQAILSRNQFLLLHKEDRQRLATSLPLYVKRKSGWRDLTQRWQHKDGTYRYLESNAVPLLNEQGKLYGFRCASRDVTERKEAEEQIRQHKHTLQEAAKISSLWELASALSHELNQPLAAINNFIAGCIKRLQKKGNQQDQKILLALQKAAEQAERAGKIIHSMKDFARQGKIELKAVGINEIMIEVKKLIHEEYPRTDIKINIETYPGNLYVKVDKIQIEQVLLNLVHNAIEAMKEAHTVEPEILICASQFETNEVIVRVIDNGPGIMNENKDKVFESFFTTKSKGLGIGLAICRTIIEAHHGQLTLHSYPVKGVCFQFTLPVV